MKHILLSVIALSLLCAKGTQAVEQADAPQAAQIFQLFEGYIDKTGKFLIPLIYEVDL